MFALYVLGCALFLCMLEKNEVVSQESILRNFCLSLSWPLLAFGLVWIRRRWLRNNFLVFFDMDSDTIEPIIIVEENFE
jgi:hypothetical protein